MLCVPVEIRKSVIHGYGVFALRDIHREEVVWQFAPGVDRVVPELGVKYAEPSVRVYILERGFINPTNPNETVLCIDEAQFMNFPPRGKEANTKLGGMLDGQYLLVAAEPIPAGTEITVPPESDFDYERKMKAHESSG
jgi:hypothetical protein